MGDFVYSCEHAELQRFDVVMPDEKPTIAEAPAATDEAMTGAVCALPAARLELPAVCPNCGRAGTLVLAGDVLFCAACGYASDGARGCT